MNKNKKSRSWAIISIFVLILGLAFSVTAQKGGLCGASDVERVSFPFDFNDGYYYNNGVIGAAIANRLTGYDKLSVWEKTCNPNYQPVRVLVTVPAYSRYGEPMFWSPLGNIDFSGFTPDKRGVFTRDIAGQFPIYIFPDSKDWTFSAYMHGRQAPVIDNSRYGWGSPVNPNPLSVRMALVVNYTEKALTKDAAKLMAYFAEKNGLAVDDTPILKSVEDINFMLANGFITAIPWSQGEGVSKETFTIAPVIAQKWAIANDAFIWMSMKDGKPLPAEDMFMTNFECMKKTGEPCKSETLD